MVRKIIMNDFTFCAIDLNISENEIIKIYQEITQVNENYWYDDVFRGCKLLPIFNSDGTVGASKPGVWRSKGEKMIWTQAGYDCPTLQNLLNEKIFTFMEPLGRISVLFTKAGNTMKVHMDSDKKSIGTIQHKFRLAIKGKIEKLYFLDKDKNKVFIPSYYPCYIIDGTHPHSIDIDDEDKMTICIGTPWRGNETPLYKNLLSQSPFKFKVSRPTFEQQWECK